MKITKKSINKIFIPVSITIETQEELSYMLAILFKALQEMDKHKIVFEKDLIMLKEMYNQLFVIEDDYRGKPPYG